MFMLGEVFKIKREHKKAVKTLSNNMETGQTMMQRGAEMNKRHGKRLFALLYKKYPGLEGFDFSVDHTNMTLIITGEKSKIE